ncbi:hypothetical protein IT409_01125 [Candidatus Falkowbacteria bacterium]|nr:hypothetical protein [Candidatus Falkowbacteria bacterium]
MINAYLKVRTIVKTNKPGEITSFFREIYELKEPILIPHAPSHGHHITIPISETQELFFPLVLIDSMRSTLNARIDVMVDQRKTDQNAIVRLSSKGVHIDLFVTNNHQLYYAISSNPLWTKSVIQK